MMINLDELMVMGFKNITDGMKTRVTDLDDDDLMDLAGSVVKLSTAVFQELDVRRNRGKGFQNCKGVWV